jgi:hypothetical protein
MSDFINFIINTFTGHDMITEKDSRIFAIRRIIHV